MADHWSHYGTAFRALPSVFSIWPALLSRYLIIISLAAAASSLVANAAGLTLELRLRGRLHRLLSVVKSFEIALTLLISCSPFDLAACYGIADCVGRLHDVMGAPSPYLVFRMEISQERFVEGRSDQQH